MTGPSVACGLVRLHVFGPDTTTSRGYLSGIGAAGTYSKAWADSSLSFQANGLEAAMVASSSMLDDAFVVVELDVGGVWTAITTPYLLAPGEGTVIGPTEGSAKEFSPVAAGALKGLLDELAILPTECDSTSPTLRYACGIEGNRYRGWQSKDFTEGNGGETWNSADVWTTTSGMEKFGQPHGFGDLTAAWVYRNADEGGLSLFRFGTFTLATRTFVRIQSSADEEHKIYLDGPNMGGVVIDSTANELGYLDVNVWQKRLEPGTYGIYGEMTTVNSTGGDGNDSIKMSCHTRDGYGQVVTVLLNSSAAARVHRQPKSDVRPGLPAGKLLLSLLQDNSDLGMTGADILLSSATFTAANDSSSLAWEDGQEWVWPLGTPLSQVFADLLPVCDLDLSPTFEFKAWNERGAASGVTLSRGADPATAAMNVVEYGYSSDPLGPTRYLTLSQDGFDIVVGTTAEASNRPRFGYLESSSSASISRARSNAELAIAQSAGLRRYYHGRIIAVSGAVPCVNFTVADDVTGLNYTATATALEVLSITWQQPGESEAQSVQFNVELGEPS